MDAELEITSYSGSNAKEKAKAIIKLQNYGKFADISVPSASVSPVPSASTIRTIRTRERILGEIIEKLKDGKISMIGICGMGGIGKTTMAEQVVERVMEDKLFDEWAMITIGQIQNDTRAQSEIAEILKLKLEEQSSIARKDRLCRRLNNKRVLIVLDDVWEEFDLKILGITFSGLQTGCKILFTSREQDLWRRPRAKIDFPLVVLSEKDAWDLFEGNVRDSLEDKPELQLLAVEIVKECGGLPLALVTLGAALLGREEYEGRDTLRQLKTDYRTNIGGVSAKIHQSLELSYKFLNNKDAKSLFLLCCMFEEDTNISIEELVRVALGLRLFEGIHGFEHTKDRVFLLIQQLKRRSLLLPSSSLLSPSSYRDSRKSCIKMHDVVRDVAKSIAQIEKVALVVDNSAGFVVWQEKGMLKYFKWISIMSKEIREFPTELSSGLELLRCSTTVLLTNNSFHGEMAKLRVLDVNGKESPMSQLPSTLVFPSSLRTLIFRECNLSSTTVIGDLPNLENLGFMHSHMKELPIEIGHMANLVSLDLSNCYSLTKIRHGVISKLCKLKELYMKDIAVDWDGEGNASLEEFRSLPNLHTLHIMIKDPGVLPSSPIFSNLKRYVIGIGKEYDFDFFYTKRDKCCSISLSSFIPLEGDIKFPSENAEELLLEGEFTKGLVHNSVQYGSQSLKRLDLNSIGTLEYLTEAANPLLLSNLESLFLCHLPDLQQISCNPLMVGSFANLKQLSVHSCGELKNIFGLSIVRELKHLESLDIEDCDGMEEVIWKEGEEDASNRLAFPKLKRLELIVLDRLKSFCRGIDEIEFPQLNELSLGNIPEAEYCSGSSNSSIFPEKVSFPNLQKLELFNMDNIKDIWGSQVQSGSFRNLEFWGVTSCHKLRFVFTHAIARYLVHLRELSIERCALLEVVIAKEKEEVEDTTLLPKMYKVKLKGLPALESFCYVEHELEFLVLKEVEVA